MVALYTVYLMFGLAKTLVALVFLFTAFATIVDSTSATAVSFRVPAGNVTIRTLNLAVEDRVVVKFSVTGAPNSVIAFSIDYPNGTTEAFGNLGGLSHSFVCDNDGSCVLRFSNEDLTHDKVVALDYEIQHYIFGMPQMLFLAIFVVLICVAMVAVFILMGKPH